MSNLFENWQVTMETLSVSVKVEVGHACYTEDDILTAVREQLEEVAPAVNQDQIDALEFSDIVVSDWQDVPEWLQDLETLSEFCEASNSSFYDLEVWEAGHACGVAWDDIEEAYSGSYESDKRFAEDIADQLGVRDNTPAWPYTCVDWEWAARELMMDYSEENGHYFRNL